MHQLGVHAIRQHGQDAIQLRHAAHDLFACRRPVAGPDLDLAPATQHVQARVGNTPGNEYLG